MNEAAELPCHDKLRFASAKEAKASAVTIEHQRGTKLKPYKCKYCELWHLASNWL